MNLPGAIDSGLREEDYRLIAESVPHIVWMAGPDGATVYFNRQGTEYTGFPREANYGWDWVGLVHPDDADRARRDWEESIRSQQLYESEFRVRRFDGIFRWHEFRALPVRNDSGQIKVWIGTATDIEERKQLQLSVVRSEREAKQALALLHAIGSGAPVGAKLVGTDLRVLMINDALARFGGLPADAYIGGTVEELWPDIWQVVGGAYRRALAGETVLNVEVSAAHAGFGGQVRDLLCSYYPVRVAGDLVGVGNVVFDITERRKAEQARDALARASIDAIAAAVEARDPYTAGHQRRVGEIAAAIASRLGIPEAESEGIVLAAKIHDLGKLAIPSEILTRPTALHPAEYELIKTHSRAGYDIIKDIAFPWPVADMVLQHHERLDGSGYPDRLKDDEILVGSRIVAVADVVEAHGLTPAISVQRRYARGPQDNQTRTRPSVRCPGSGCLPESVRRWTDPQRGVRAWSAG